MCIHTQLYKKGKACPSSQWYVTHGSLTIRQLRVNNRVVGIGRFLKVSLCVTAVYIVDGGNSPFVCTDSFSHLFIEPLRRLFYETYFIDDNADSLCRNDHGLCDWIKRDSTKCETNSHS